MVSAPFLLQCVFSLFIYGNTSNNFGTTKLLISWGKVSSYVFTFQLSVLQSFCSSIFFFLRCITAMVGNVVVFFLSLCVRITV